MKRILLVDDDEQVLTFYRNALEHMANGNFALAESADEALKIASTFKPDIIFSDYNMPGENGYSFLRKIKDKYPDSIRIIVTANPFNIKEPIDDVAHILMGKPVHLYELRAIVDMLYQKPL
ncbi:response regulator [Candidatus Woesearchaeota archaeon]|nr:response regulator [Candidatus Woesearchaeota archaeon]